jgi:hypothetical protein
MDSSFSYGLVNDGISQITAGSRAVMEFQSGSNVLLFT